MFGGLFGKKKGVEVEKIAPVSSAIASSILGTVGARGIPPMPGAAQKAFQLSTDPNAEARDFIDVIESDEGLSARVMKIANSVYFDRGKPSATIEEAVLVIGINELRCLLGATTLSEIFPSKHPARTQLWANDIATALVSRELAKRLLPGKEESAFLAGLMHDIGKLLLLQRSSDQYLPIISRVENQGCEFAVAEEEAFVFNHTEVGQLVGEKWNFSDELRAVIRGHHRPWQELNFAESPSLTAIVKGADIISHSLGLGHPKGFQRLRKRYEEQLGEAWLALGIPESDQKAVLANAQKIFDLEYELFSGKAAGHS